MPASDRFTMSTWVAWSSTERLRCSTPTPPWRAIAIAIRASVTVSIGLDSNGVLIASDRDNRVAVSASLGRMSEAAGTSSTSSKVRPSAANFAGIVASMDTSFSSGGCKAPSYRRLAWVGARRLAHRPLCGRSQ
jgi:hypothetical protein